MKDSIMNLLTKNFVLLLSGLLACVSGNWFFGALIGLAGGALNCVFAGAVQRKSKGGAIAAVLPSGILCAVVCGFGAGMAGPEFISFTGIAFTIVTCLLCVVLGSFMSQSKLVQEQEEDREEPRATRNIAPKPQPASEPTPEPTPMPVISTNPTTQEQAENTINAFAAMFGQVQVTPQTMIIDGLEYSPKAVQEIRRVLCLDETAEIKAGHIDLFLNTMSKAARRQYSGKTKADLINNFCEGKRKTVTEYYEEQDEFFKDVPEAFLIACLPRNAIDPDAYLFDHCEDIYKQFLKDLPDPIKYMPMKILIELIPPSERFGEEEECIRNNVEYLAELFCAQLPLSLKFIPVNTLWLTLDKKFRTHPAAPIIDVKQNALELMKHYEPGDVVKYNSPLECLLPSWLKGIELQTLLNRLQKVDANIANEKSSPWIKVLNHVDWLKAEAPVIASQNSTHDFLLDRAPNSMLRNLIIDSADVQGDDDLSDDEFIQKYLNKPNIRSCIYCEDLPKPLNKIPLMMLKTLIYDKTILNKPDSEEIAIVRDYVVQNVALFQSLFDANASGNLCFIPTTVREHVVEEEYSSKIDPELIYENEYWRMWLPNPAASAYTGDLVGSNNTDDPDLWVINNYRKVKLQ